MKAPIQEIMNELQLVKLSEGFRLNDFKCHIDEYSQYLKEKAVEHQELGIASSHLLINKKNADVMAYMVLITDCIPLSPAEKDLYSMDGIPFSSFPAMKIGKLAVDDNYNSKYSGIGSLMIEIARGIAFDVHKSGVACKFITIDADIEHNPQVELFYEKNGFKINEKKQRKNQRTVSMRLDIFEDQVEINKEKTS